MHTTCFWKAKNQIKKRLYFAQRKNFLRKISAEIFMLKKRIFIKNADSSPTVAKLKTQSQRQNHKRSFAGGKNAPTRIESNRGKHSAIL